MNKELLRTHNRAKCLICNDIIESKHVHDYVTCSCGNVSVDGGREYDKRSFKELKYPSFVDLPYEDISIEVDPFESLRTPKNFFHRWLINLKKKLILRSKRI